MAGVRRGCEPCVQPELSLVQARCAAHPSIYGETALNPRARTRALPWPCAPATAGGCTSCDRTRSSSRGCSFAGFRATDWACRRVLSHRVSIGMDTSFCLEALEEACAKYGHPEIFNIDQGEHELLTASVVHCVASAARPPPWTTLHRCPSAGLHLSNAVRCSDKPSHLCVGQVRSRANSVIVVEGDEALFDRVGHRLQTGATDPLARRDEEAPCVNSPRTCRERTSAAR